jgi:putative ABC transport system ATP-binding protein
MSEPILRFENVTREYPLGDTKTFGLKSVSVEFHPGEYAAIVGPSGSGKSTLQHLGAGFDRPSSGHVFLMGKDLRGYKESGLSRLRNECVGFIFQTFNLMPVLSAEENVLYPALIRAASAAERRECRERARGLLRRVGLDGSGAKRPHQLSGGQRQRVAIARALMNRPRIVFADEPTANLDHETGSGVLDILGELNAQEGSTLILATHDPAVMKRARRIVRLKDGRVEADEA